MTPQNELFYPPIELLMGETTTGMLLYSTNLTSRYGKDARLELYFDYRVFHEEIPRTIKIMCYLAPPNTDNRVFQLQRYWKVHAAVIRYDPCTTEEVGTVYFPRAMFEATPPNVCFLEIIL
jgi:hypothetical protein